MKKNVSDSESALLNFLRNEFLCEQESDFARLRRIPSTRVRQFLDYFLALNESDQNELSEALAQLALCSFFPCALHPYKLGNVAYKRYVEASRLVWSWKYENIRSLRMCLAEAEQSSEDFRLSRGITPEIMAMMRAIQPVKSAEIRRVVKLAFSQLCDSLTISNDGGGAWSYKGVHRDTEFCVKIDYGGMNDQLRCEISIRDRQRLLSLDRLSFEQIMGLSFSAWNCLEQANLDQSIALLKDLVLYCVELSRRLPSEYAQNSTTTI